MKKAILVDLSRPVGRSPGRFGRKGPARRSAGRSPALTSDVLAGLEFRNIGPALMSGRISDIVIHPRNRRDVVRRRRLGRRLEDRERRPDLEADLRLPRLLFHRLYHPRSPAIRKPSGWARARTSAAATSATATASTRA